MKKQIRNIILMFMAAVMLSGCFGSNQMFNRMNKWNGTINNKYARSAVHFAFWIIPVYIVSLAGDILVLNVIEFWGGKNPMAMNDGESETEEIEYAGKIYEVTATNKGFTVKDKETDEQKVVAYSTSAGSWTIVELAQENH